MRVLTRPLTLSACVRVRDCMSACRWGPMPLFVGCETTSSHWGSHRIPLGPISLAKTHRLAILCACPGRFEGLICMPRVGEWGGGRCMWWIVQAWALLDCFTHTPPHPLSPRRQYSNPLLPRRYKKGRRGRRAFTSTSYLISLINTSTIHRYRMANLPISKLSIRGGVESDTVRRPLKPPPSIWRTIVKE